MNATQRQRTFIRSACLLLLACSAWQTAKSQSSPQPTPPKGEVLIQSHEAPLETRTTPTDSKQPTAPPDVTDTERSALRATAYDLDARLDPATSHLAMRARVTLRNTGASPLTHVALQVSSTLTWESVTLVDGPSRTKLVFAQHRLETDADHTGNATETVITLLAPLAPAGTITLDTFYSGTVTQNATRLERLGASPATGKDADWDAITAGSTALRGFGNVLWYPVAAPQLFLGQGADLFNAVAAMKLHSTDTPVHLRLTVDYLGDPPIAAYFCGRRGALRPATDNADAPIVSSPGTATVDFPTAPLGFRTMSLFLIESPEILLPPAKETASTDPALAVATTDESSLPLLTASARDAAAVLQEWLGLQPLSSLAIIDHQGQPFEDGPLLVAPVRALITPEAGAALTHSLTHSWIQTGVPWMDEGLAQFFVLLAAERTRGREVAEAQLATLVQPLALAEPAAEPGKPIPLGEPLPSASSEMFYRRKATAVWWMLRSLSGDDALKLALEALRLQPPSLNTPEQKTLLFEAQLEKSSGKDLHWFFDDWVLHDRGLPDLNLAEVTPRELVSSTGRSTGWLIAVKVTNDGAAAADVPLIIRSGTFSTTKRIRIPGYSATTERVLVESAPTEVVLNDNTTPEQRVSLHTKAIVLHGR